MTSRRFCAVATISLATSVLFASGCEQYCADTRDSYQRALRAEHTELAEPEQLSGASPAQFGLSLKTSLIGDILNIVLQPTLDLALASVSSISVGGERIGLSSTGQLLTLDVSADSACANCFGIGGNLGGKIMADIPGMGRKIANLGGSMHIVAPLLLDRGATSDAALKLDLPAFVDIGRSSLSARLGGVDSDIANLLEGPLSQLLFRTVADRLSPVTLIEFDAPSFGIPGFKILPVNLVTNGQTGTVFAGFATNIEALNAPGAPSVAPILDLQADENFAFAFQPAIIPHSLSLLMDSGKVSRTYNLSGDATPDGHARVTMGKFRVGEEALRPSRAGNSSRWEDAGDLGDAYTEDAYALSLRQDALNGESPDVPFALGFDVFNFSSNSAICLGFGAEAVGGVSVRENALKVDLLDVRFTNDTLQDGLVQLATWSNADFIRESHNLVNQSLSQTTISVPGTSLTLGNLGLGLQSNAVVLRAHSTPAAP